MPRSGWVWLGIGAAYFFIPLAATLEFSLKEVSGYGFSSYREILSDPQFRDLLWVSFKLSLATIVVSLLILIPGVYSVHLSFPRLRPLVEFLSVLPFVVPPIILIVGLLDFYNVDRVPLWFIESPRFLIPGYVVLSFPFMFRARCRSRRRHTASERGGRQRSCA
jgi:putative spermidine/putrescine transport system permease protein